jgi:hypothetical protein
VPADHIADFTTHTWTICIRHQVLLATYCKASHSSTHLFFSCFSLYFLDVYYILFCDISLSFLIYSGFCPPPTNFAALGKRVVCIVIKRTMRIEIALLRKITCLQQRQTIIGPRYEQRYLSNTRLQFYCCINLLGWLWGSALEAVGRIFDFYLPIANPLLSAV